MERSEHLVMIHKKFSLHDTSATLKHNGVMWNYAKDSNNAITITGTGINIYKVMNGHLLPNFFGAQARKYFKQINLCHYKSYFQI